MEIKAQLNKPYTEDEKISFIVENNHKLGYLINETDTGLQALDYTKEEKQQQEIEQFNNEFFNTSLGYVRRKVKMKDGAFKDFLTDIVPLLQVGVQIITYTLNGTELTQNTGVTVTEQFINECKQQLFADFYGIS